MLIIYSPERLKKVALISVNAWLFCNLAKEGESELKGGFLIDYWGVFPANLFSIPTIKKATKQEKLMKN